MAELVVDLITSLDGYAAADGWSGWWGLETPEYLAWLGEQPERHDTTLMGASTYGSLQRRDHAGGDMSLRYTSDVLASPLRDFVEEA